MKIIIYPTFENEFKNLKTQNRTYLLYGRIYDNFTVCHLTGVSFSKSTYPIGLLTTGTTTMEEPIITAKSLEYPYIHIMVEENLSTLKADVYHNEENKDSNIDVDIEYIDLNRLFVRIDEKEAPLRVLNKKRVAIIGMGSGGALLALYLAKSGVKEFIFIDDDHLETHNIIRHICDLDNLGRFKTLAVKDYIKARIPDVKIQTVERKFDLHTKADFDFFNSILLDMDLIAAVSGEHDVNYAINDFIHSNQLNIPVIYAGTFDGVKGGLMFKVDPRNEDFCYHCIYSKPDENGTIQTKAIPTTIELEQKISYDRTLQEQLAQPGLGLDVDNLTILLSKFCLDILLTGGEHSLYHFPHNFYMWFNRTIMKSNESSVKFEGLELYYYEDLEKDSNCPFHGTQALKIE
ncbi:MAG: ThiF family adenylyltransferase [Candidatus Heimdallarchaeota archaeon]|nr:MAG: ThiF family adenylyltransferase [Candidatus Heimdallarchaeota archaeon]